MDIKLKVGKRNMIFVMCHDCSYCSHPPNLFLPYYWCTLEGKEVTKLMKCKNYKQNI